MVQVLVTGPLGSRGEVRLQFDDGPKQSFAFDLKDGDGRISLFEADLPADVRKITYERTNSADGSTGSKSYDVFDLGQFTDVLWRDDWSFCRRVLALNYALGQVLFGRDADEYGYKPKPRGLFSPYRLIREDRWLQGMYDVAASNGVAVPAALGSFAKLNIEPDMGGGVWCGPGQKLVTGNEPAHALAPNIVVAKKDGAAKCGMAQDRFDILMSVYDRAITVAADANHFSGVIWDPVGITAQEVAVFDGEGDRLADGGVFWKIQEDSWQRLELIRDKDGQPAGADQVMRDCFLTYFARDMGEKLLNEEKASEDTVFLDHNVPAKEIVLGELGAWMPFDCEPYRD